MLQKVRWDRSHVVARNHATTSPSFQPPTREKHQTPSAALVLRDRFDAAQDGPAGAAGTTDAGEALLEVSAREELADGFVENGSPVAAPVGVAVGVDGAGIVKVFADEAMEVTFMID